MGNQTWTGVVVLLLMLGAGPALAQTCQPASIPASTPDSQLQDNGDGTVTALKTGLMWKQCAEGLSGSDCATGSLIEFNIWQQALQRAQTVNSGGGYAGFTDWRVPNIKELASLTELQCMQPAINLTRFPNTPNNYFWSSSIYAGDGSYTQLVGRSGEVTGFSNNVPYDKPIYKPLLRLVRSVL